MSGRKLTFDAAVSEFLDYCESKNLTENTIRWYGQHLRNAARFLSSKTPFATDVTLRDLREWVTDMLGSVSPSTVNHHVTTLKTFYRFLVDEDIMESSPADRLPKVKSVQKLIQPFSTEQLDALIGAPTQRRFAGFRDRRLMMLLLDTALRISEAVNIRMKGHGESRRPAIWPSPSP